MKIIITWDPENSVFIHLQCDARILLFGILENITSHAPQHHLLKSVIGLDFQVYH